MDTVFSFIIELARLVGSRIVKILNLNDVNEEIEMIVGLIFVFSIFGILIYVLIL